MLSEKKEDNIWNMLKKVTRPGNDTIEEIFFLRCIEDRSQNVVNAEEALFEQVLVEEHKLPLYSRDLLFLY